MKKFVSEKDEFGEYEYIFYDKNIYYKYIGDVKFKEKIQDLALDCMDVYYENYDYSGKIFKAETVMTFDNVDYDVKFTVKMLPKNRASFRFYIS